MNTPGLAAPKDGRRPIAVFRLMRVASYGQGHDVVKHISVYDEQDLLDTLQSILPSLTPGDSLVGMDENALGILLKHSVRRGVRRAHFPKNGRRR